MTRPTDDPEFSVPLCLGLAAATDALRAATVHDDIEAMLRHQAALHELAAALSGPGERGVSHSQTLSALVSARDAVGEAQAALEILHGRQAADGHRKRRLQLAYGDNGGRP